MSQIPPLNLKPQMIPRMQHLMRHRILDMPPIPQLVRTQQDPILAIEPATLPRRTPLTPHVLRVDVLPQFVDLLPQEAYHGAVLQKVVPMLGAARAVGGFFDGVARVEVALSVGGGRLAG